MHFRFDPTFNARGWVAVTALSAVLMAAMLAGAAVAPAAESPNAVPPPADSVAHALVWDATEKLLRPKPGETSAAFQFTATNITEKPVTILQVRPTCGCTIAEMPSSPWVLGPHESGTLVGTIDFRGRDGTETKAIFVNSNLGTQTLRITVRLPVVDEAGRQANQRIAQANRQAVFSGSCAQCHAAPTVDRMGGDLFVAACGVCHLSGRRASFVPDLLVARQHRDAAFWRRWIREGKDGTLMPAWSKERGGPLADEQIESLVEFAMRTLPSEPR